MCCRIAVALALTVLAATPAAAAADISLRPIPATYVRAAVGADGNVWLGSYLLPGKLARVSPTTGALTEFALDDCSVEQMISGADGNVWFYCIGDYHSTRIGRVDPSGAVAFADAGG